MDSNDGTELRSLEVFGGVHEMGKECGFGQRISGSTV